MFIKLSIRGKKNCDKKCSGNFVSTVTFILTCIPQFIDTMSLTYLMCLLPTIGHFLNCHHLIGVSICGLC